MPSESELRESLRGPRDPGAAIDVDAVIRRARARRRPRVVLATGVGALALAGVLVPVGVLALERTGPAALTAASDEAGASAPEVSGDELGVASAAELDRCGSTLAELEPAADGLVLEVDPVDAPAASDEIPVVVTLRNGGSGTVRGTISASPTITLSRDDVVLARGPAAHDALDVDLGPGESLRFDAAFAPVVCGPGGDPGDVADEPAAAAPGEYDVRAAVDFVDADGTRVLVSGPTAVVTLR